jgi:hypothetical protein
MKTFSLIKYWLLTKNNYMVVSGILAGLAGGFLYYYFIGCRTGSCPITSSPWISMLWGAVMGYLIFDMFRAKKKEINPGESKNPKKSMPD